MKVLKWIFIVLIGIIIALLIFSAFLPSKLIIDETIVVNAPQEQVFNEITDFKSWDNWSPWHAMDPDMKQEYSESMGEIGSFYQWWSNNSMVGNGRQDVTEIEANQFMKTKMTFEGMPPAYASFEVSDENGSSKITWAFEGSETPFYARLMNTMIEPMLRNNYQTGLKNLKKYIEELPPVAQVPNPYNLEMVELEAQPIISILDSTTEEGFNEKLGSLYQELFMHLATAENAEQSGKPLAFYYTFSADNVVLEAAIPFNGEVEGNDRIQVKETPAGPAIKGIHIGDYESSVEMHTGIGGYAAASGKEIVGACWEVYITTSEEVDESEQETHIYYPVK